MTFEMHICLQFRSGSQRHPFWHRWIHHWVDTVWPSRDPWSCAVNVWKLGEQHELVKLCKMKNNTIICVQLRRSNHVIWHKIWSNGTKLFFFTWIRLVSARNIVLWQRFKSCIVNYNNETFDMVNDATPDKFSFNNFTTSENSQIWYIYCIDTFLLRLIWAFFLFESVYRTLLHRQSLTSLWEWSGTEIEEMGVPHCHHSSFYWLNTCWNCIHLIAFFNTNEFKWWIRLVWPFLICGPEAKSGVVSKFWWMRCITGYWHYFGRMHGLNHQTAWTSNSFSYGSNS